MMLPASAAAERLIQPAGARRCGLSSRMCLAFLTVPVVVLAISGCETAKPGPPRTIDPPYRIDVEPIVTIGSPDDSLLLDWNVSLAANDQVIVAGRLPTRGALALYDWEGRQVDRIISSGGGPGEFGFPRPALGPGDSIWIFDPGNQRVSVLEPDGRSIARAFSLRGQANYVMGADSGLAIIAGTLLPAGLSKEEVDEAVWPYLHVIDRRGAVVRSFLPSGSGIVGPRIIAANGDRIWLASMHRPTLEEWSLAGERLRVIDRDLDWFEPWDTTRAGALEGLRYRPRVAGLGVDGKGRVWVKTYIPLVDRESVRSTADYNRVMDTLIEVVDPETGQLLAQRRFDPAYISRVGGRDLWATVRQDSAGYVFVDIWRGQLRDR